MQHFKLHYCLLIIPKNNAKCSRSKSHSKYNSLNCAFLSLFLITIILHSVSAQCNLRVSYYMHEKKIFVSVLLFRLEQLAVHFVITFFQLSVMISNVDSTEILIVCNPQSSTISYILYPFLLEIIFFNSSVLNKEILAGFSRDFVCFG